MGEKNSLSIRMFVWNNMNIIYYAYMAIFNIICVLTVLSMYTLCVSTTFEQYLVLFFIAHQFFLHINYYNYYLLIIWNKYVDTY